MPGLGDGKESASTIIPPSAFAQQLMVPSDDGAYGASSITFTGSAHKEDAEGNDGKGGAEKSSENDSRLALTVADMTTGQSPVDEEIEIPDDLDDEVNWRTLLKVFKLITSYDLTAGVLIIAFGITRLGQDGQDYGAAANLSQAASNTIGMLALSPLFSVSVLISHLVGELKKSDLSTTEKREIKRRIAAIYQAALIVSIPLLFVFTPPLIFANYFLVSQSSRVVRIASEFLRGACLIVL